MLLYNNYYNNNNTENQGKTNGIEKYKCKIKNNRQTTKIKGTKKLRKRTTSLKSSSLKMGFRE